MLNFKHIFVTACYVKRSMNIAETNRGDLKDFEAFNDLDQSC
ncbi:hypothetical protein LINGRAHAP2_LOCUS26866 [Linum grandiflorum]